MNTAFALLSGHRSAKVGPQDSIRKRARVLKRFIEWKLKIYCVELRSFKYRFF